MPVPTDVRGPIRLRRIGGLLRLAWWQLRGRWVRSLLLATCVAIGVAACVSVASFVGRFENTVSDQSRALLMADLELRSRERLDEALRVELRDLLPSGSASQEMVGVVTMAASVEQPRSHLIKALAVEPGFPWYGRVELADGQTVDALFGDAGQCFAQRDLLVHLDLAVGDELRIGRGRFRIAGLIDDLPGLGVGGFALGSRVLIARSDLEDTGLVGVGARVRWRTLVRLPPGHDAEAVVEQIRSAWDLPDDADDRSRGLVGEQAISLRSHVDADRQVRRNIDRLGDFLGLVALSALLIAGVGIAYVARDFVTRELDDLAVLHVLGAAPHRLFTVVLLQALGAALVGALAGCALGTLMQAGVSGVLSGFLPIEVTWGLHPPAIVNGLLMAVLVTLLFACEPLLSVLGLRPMAVLRGDPPRGGAWRRRLLVLALVVGGVLSAAWWITGDAGLSIAYVGGLLVLLVAVLLLALALRSCLLPLVGRLPAFALRFGVGALLREPGRQAPAFASLALIAILASFLLVYRASLLQELHGGEEMPTLFAINIQGSDREEMHAYLSEQWPTVAADFAPMIRARLRSIDGVDVRAIDDGEGEDARRGRRWRLREQNLSWRGERGPDEEVVAGSWMQVERDYQLDEVAEASLERDFAEAIGAGLGSVLEFDVQGVPLRARVTSLRKVRWESFRPNFFILLSPGLLREVPGSWVAALEMAESERRIDLQTVLVERFPEMSIFDVAGVVAKIDALLDQVASAIAFLALYCLAAGILVLLGMAFANARRRREEAALLRLLGAGDRSILLMAAVEGLLLGFCAAAVGMLLGMAGAWFLVEAWLDDLDPHLPWWHCVALLTSIALCTLLCSLAACWRVLRDRPLAVLRAEGAV